MTDKEYNAYFDRLLCIEEDKCCTLKGTFYDFFVTGVAMFYIGVKKLSKCGHKSLNRVSSSDVVDVFVPWSMKSSVCEDPGQLDEPEIY